MSHARTIPSNARTHQENGRAIRRGERLNMDIDKLRHEHAQACIVEQCSNDPMERKAASDRADMLGRQIALEQAYIKMQGWLAASKMTEEYLDKKAFFLKFQDARLEWLKLTSEIVAAKMDAAFAPRGA